MSKRTSLVRIELATPSVPTKSPIESEPWLLKYLTMYEDMRGLFYLADGISKERLGTHYGNIPPLCEGGYVLELGAVLPDLLPNCDGNAEYVLNVLVDGTTYPICVSNIMARFRFEKDGAPCHALASRRAIAAIKKGEVAQVPASASVELLRTFATVVFHVPGATAEEAMECNIESCIHNFMMCLNNIIRALPQVEPDGLLYSTVYGRRSFGYFYLLVRGEDKDKCGTIWVAPFAPNVFYNPSNITGDQVNTLTQYLNGEMKVDDVASLLHAAKSYMESGALEYVLLLMVIAAEVATERFVSHRLRSEGVSETKLKNAKDDLKYSTMTNVLLFALTSANEKPDRELIGDMNAARGMRNDFMHRGVKPSDENVIKRYLISTKRYVDYLHRISTESQVNAND